LKKGSSLKRPIALLLLAFLVTSLAATGYALATTPFLTHAIFSTHNQIDGIQDLSSQQGITGTVTIANVSPICTVTGSVPATGPDLIITSSNGRTTQDVALSWTLQNQCQLVAPFRVTLSPGTYSLNLSSCNYMGCRVLPITVVVVPGVFTPAKISIITGIY
jgi:hypothetical protein